MQALQEKVRGQIKSLMWLFAIHKQCFPVHAKAISVNVDLYVHLQRAIEQGALRDEH